MSFPAMMQFHHTLSQIVFCLLLLPASGVHGHGRLIEPPSRSSMWRSGFSSPKNYNDNELFCGGFQRQWGKNKGRCGVCGDPWDGERQNEAGGKYANGIIVRKYNQGQTITVAVDLTANHLGYFEFRLCPHNSPQTPVTQSCLDKHVLPHRSGSQRFNVTSSLRGNYTMEVVLPADVTCSQCVIQWKYNTGNSWGCQGSDCCVGCGPQEQFYGCADVEIAQSEEQTINSTSQPSTVERAQVTDVTSTTTTTNNSVSSDVTSTDKVPGGATSSTKPSTVTTGDSDTVTMTTWRTDDDTNSRIDCKAVGPWAGNPRVTAWCIGNCVQGFCPVGYCSDDCRRIPRQY